MLFCQLQCGCLYMWIAVSYSGKQGKPGWVDFWLGAFKHFECSTTHTVLCLQIQNNNLCCSPSVMPEGILREKTAGWLWRLAGDSRNVLEQVIDTNWFWCFSSLMKTNKDKGKKQRERKGLSDWVYFFPFFVTGFGYVPVSLVSDSMVLRCLNRSCRWVNK